MFICEFCGKEYKKFGIKNHERFCNLNPNKEEKSQKWKNAHIGKSGSNQYIKAKEDGRTIEMPDETRKKISDSLTGKKFSKERREALSAAMLKAVKENPDSYTKNNVCGRVKIVEYNGIKLKGQWELKTAKWLDSQFLKWKNEPQGFPYIWKDKERLYFPDFYLPDLDVYIEVKGYKTEKDDANWSQFPEVLLVVDNTIIDRLDNMSIEDLMGL